MEMLHILMFYSLQKMTNHAIIENSPQRNMDYATDEYFFGYPKRGTNMQHFFNKVFAEVITLHLPDSVFKK